MNKFQVGQKVKLPKTKSAGWGTLEESAVYKIAKEQNEDYAYVIGYYNSTFFGGVVRVSNCPWDINGDFFKEEDLELYETPRKFKNGDKVAMPKQKTAGVSTIEDVQAYYAGKKFLYVKGYDNIFDEYYISDNNEEGAWDYCFNEEDLELYEEPKFEVGQKVKIPKQKTGGYVKLKDSLVIDKAKELGQDYLTVRFVFNDGQIELVPNESCDYALGELYNPKDLEPYVEPVRTYKRGDKVKIPVTKSAGNTTVEQSCVIRNAKEKGQDFLYFMMYEGGDKVSLNDVNEGYGDYFRVCDLEPYVPQKKERIRELLKEIDELLEDL